jgi:hypothetical protein
MRGAYLSKKVTLFLPLLHTTHFSAATCVPITAVLIISRSDFIGIHKNGFNLFCRNTCGMDKNIGIKQKKTTKRADIAVMHLTLIRMQAGTLQT